MKQGIFAMNKTTIIAIVAAAYATAIAASFSLGFMLGPRQVPTGDGHPGTVTSRTPASQDVHSDLGGSATAMPPRAAHSG